MIFRLLFVLVWLLFCAALWGPWGLLIGPALVAYLALARWLPVWRAKRRMIAAQRALEVAQERQRVADLELAEARERARAAGWMMPSADSFSAN
jgi:hypothetical protein